VYCSLEGCNHNQSLFDRSYSLFNCVHCGKIVGVNFNKVCDFLLYCMIFYFSLHMVTRCFLIYIEERLISSLEFSFSLHLSYKEFWVCTFLLVTPSLTLILSPISIVMHWIFSLSNHDKGECNFYEVVVKCSIRYFILDCMCTV
jgi:hypothetical protein